MIQFWLPVIVAIAVFAIILIPNAVEAELASGVYKLTYKNNLYDIPYTITDANLIKIIKDEQGGGVIGVTINPQNAGNLTVSIPRELIDPLDYSGKLTILGNGIITNYYDLETNCDYRKIMMSFDKNITDFSIGVGVGVPEYKGYDADITKLYVQGYQADILTHQQGAICNIDFNQQEKKITITTKGVKSTSDPFDITIPSKLLNGNFSVLTDGEKREFDIQKTENDSKLSFLLDYPASNERKIEIVGTQAIPEFPLSIPILAVSIGSLIVFYQMKLRNRFKIVCS